MLLVIFHCFLAWDFLLSRSKYFYFLDDRTYSFGTFYFDQCENVTFDEVVDSAGNSPRKIEREQNQIHMVSVVKYICLYFPSGFGDHKTSFIFKIAGLLIFGFLPKSQRPYPQEFSALISNIFSMHISFSVSFILHRKLWL